jgi:hypothetical protein
LFSLLVHFWWSDIDSFSTHRLSPMWGTNSITFCNYVYNARCMYVFYLGINPFHFICVILLLILHYYFSFLMRYVYSLPVMDKKSYKHLIPGMISAYFAHFSFQSAISIRCFPIKFLISNHLFNIYYKGHVYPSRKWKHDKTYIFV